MLFWALGGKESDPERIWPIDTAGQEGRVDRLLEKLREHREKVNALAQDEKVE